MLSYLSESCKIFMLKIVGIKLRETGSCVRFVFVFIWKRILKYSSVIYSCNKKLIAYRRQSVSFVTNSLSQNVFVPLTSEIILNYFVLNCMTVLLFDILSCLNGQSEQTIKLKELICITRRNSTALHSSND